MKKLKDLPNEARPREKLINKGTEALSDHELIAILLRTGTKEKNVLEIAQELMQKFGNFSSLGKKSIRELTEINGIGNDKAVTLAAAFEIGKRTAVELANLTLTNKIISPVDVADIFIPLLRDETKENFYIVCLNASNRIIKYQLISVGTLDASLVHPREVFKAAIQNDSKNLILVHNHPSGNPEPSEEDFNITKRLIEAGKLLNINVLDHIIIAGGKFTSIIEKRKF